MSSEGQQSAMAANADVMSELTGATISSQTPQGQRFTGTDVPVYAAHGRKHISVIFQTVSASTT